MFVVGGESLIDLVAAPRQIGGIMEMQAHQGGSPYNCAIALAKLSQPTGYLCPISQDGFGSYLLEPLEAAGVACLLKARVTQPTTLAVVTLNARKEAQYEFYRGADRAFTRAGLIAALPERMAGFQIGGFCPIEPEDAQVWLDVAEAALARGTTMSIDPNVRPSLVSDFAAYKARLDRFLDLAHLIKVSEEDLMALDADKSISEHALELLSRPNCQLVVVTLGEKGSQAFTRGAEAAAGIWSPPEFGDTVGAGDSLMAGILAILSENGDLTPERLGKLNAGKLAEILRFGAVVAGLNCAHKGCNPPSRAEVEAVLAQA